MKKLSGFLYGHYDSRGGTTFVQAQTKEEADNKFFNQAFGDETLKQEEWFESLEVFLDPDRLGHVFLNVPDDFDQDQMHGRDLENCDPALEEALAARLGRTSQYWEELINIPALGVVLAPGHNTSMEQVEEDEDSDFFDVVEGVELEFVPTGRQPQVLKSFCNPRWDDDAYSFIFVK